jgi:flagellar hook-basal body complex protein FliE
MDPIAFGRIIAPALIPSPRIEQLEEPGGGPEEGSFAALLGESMARVQQMHNEADLELRRLLAGESVELHRVILAGEQAGLASEFLMAARNKLVDAYQEIMRMQV